MVELANLIDEKRVLLDVTADCPKAVFRCVAEVLAPETGIEARDIANALNERERIGTTAVGGGVSIPHARLEAVHAPQAYFLRLQQAINMDALDDEPVDIFFILLVPKESDNEHLRILSRITRLIRQPESLLTAKNSQDPKEIASLFTQGST